MTTANWNIEPGDEDYDALEPWKAFGIQSLKTTTWYSRFGTRKGLRKVKHDLSIKWMGHYFVPREDVVIKPIPGEWLLVYDYGEANNQNYINRGGKPVMNEWTAPADPDHYIRRIFWEFKK